jgi:chromosome segregation protein
VYLKALRMRGFKSFPGSVELQFEHGIAVVVGPNGSGKSNIADALQWAMAVQSPSQLRAPTGLDVLFGGSDSRPPAGVCEVELVLDNECGTLPLEFGEVSVMRRLDRGGESEYLVNRARVRRLDVLELLADTGLGREMHSVIGQGRVDEILTSKPHERRRFVEEAAGLGKYQRRRLRAEAKLARVSSELERARDLEREVRARLRPLQMQATAAERAAKLGGEIAAGRLRLIASDTISEQRRADAARARLSAAHTAQADVDAKLKVIGERRAKAEAELTGLAAEQERATRAYYDFETARERLSDGARRLEGAAASLGRAHARRTGLAGRLTADAERFLAEAAEATEQAEAAAGEAERLAASDGGELREAAAAAETALTASLDARRALAEAQGHAGTARLEADRSAARADELEARVESLAAAAAEAQAGLTSGAETAGGLEVSAKTLAAELEAAVAAAGESRTEAERTATAARAAVAAADELGHRGQLMNARLDALRQALDRGEGLTPAVRALKEAGAKLVVAGVEAQPGFERAVAAGLGWRAGAVVAERLTDALSVLAEAGGEVAVVLADTRPPAASLPPAPGARPLIEVVTVRDPVAGRLLEGVWLVDDLAQVDHGVAVTQAGEGIDADRGELWRTGDAGEAAWLAARAERERLETEAEGLAAEHAAAVTAAEQAAADAGRAEQADSETQAALAAVRAREASASEAARTAAARRDRLADELARSESAREAAEKDLASESERRVQLAGEADRLEAAAAERGEAAQAADHRHAALELRRRELADAAARVAAREAGLRERGERFRRDATRLRSAAERARASAESSGRLAAGARALEERGREIGRTLVRLTAAAELLRAPARAGVAVIERRSGELAAELQACAHDEAGVQTTARSVAATATEIEVELTRSTDRIAELGRRGQEISADLSEDAEPLDEPLPPEERESVAARMERLERRRESLGAVNPLAAEEYETEKRRTGELTEQCADLEKSLRELRGLIRDLTQTIDRRFAETFEQVARNFTEVIRTLFPGGSGRLRLTDNEVVSAAPAAAEGEAEAEATEGEEELRRPDEPGIELEVKPAGKRIEALSLLSGGEKALTAIAFLFSLLLTKPSPFYVLDEVEAALDDANIERFLDLLRAYQERAQFIVITHQRRTMEVADLLYGVTMAGDGESKVLSRRVAADMDLRPAG